MTKKSSLENSCSSAPAGNTELGSDSGSYTENNGRHPGFAARGPDQENQKSQNKCMSHSFDKKKYNHKFNEFVWSFVIHCINCSVTYKPQVTHTPAHMIAPLCTTVNAKETRRRARDGWNVKIKKKCYTKSMQMKTPLAHLISSCTPFCWGWLVKLLPANYLFVMKNIFVWILVRFRGEKKLILNTQYAKKDKQEA